MNSTTRTMLYNVGKTYSAHESLFSSTSTSPFTSLHINEPYLPPDPKRWRSFLSTRYPAWRALLPVSPPANESIRTAVFVAAAVDPTTYRQLLINKTRDVVGVDFDTPIGVVRRITIYADQTDANFSVLDVIRPFCKDSPDFQHLIMEGDCNTPNSPLWAPARGSAADARTSRLEDFIMELPLCLALPPGTTTRRPIGNQIARDSTLDLVFISPSLRSHLVICRAATDLNHGSDHIPVEVALAYNLPKIVPAPRRNYRKTDQGIFVGTWEKELRGFDFHALYRTNDPTLLHDATLHITKTFETAIEASTPMAKPCAYSNPCWNAELEERRKDLAKANSMWQTRRGEFAEDVLRLAAEIARKRFKASMTSAKLKWEKELVDRTDRTNVWRTVKTMNGARTQVGLPPIVDPNGTIASTTTHKIAAFQRAFFPTAIVETNGGEPIVKDYSHADESGVGGAKREVGTEEEGVEVTVNGRNSSEERTGRKGKEKEYDEEESENGEGGSATSGGAANESRLKDAHHSSEHLLRRMQRAREGASIPSYSTPSRPGEEPISAGPEQIAQKRRLSLTSSEPARIADGIEAVEEEVEHGGEARAGEESEVRMGERSQLEQEREESEESAAEGEANEAVNKGHLSSELLSSRMWHARESVGNPSTYTTPSRLGEESINAGRGHLAKEGSTSLTSADLVATTPTSRSRISLSPHAQPFTPRSDSPVGEHSSGKALWEPPPVTSLEIDRHFDALRSRAAAGADGAPTSHIKHGYSASWAVASAYRAVYKLSDRLAIEPRCYKDQRTIIATKPGRDDYTKVKSYRPITMASAHSKPLTALKAARLHAINERLSIVNPYQLGGRPGCSSEDKVLILMDTIHRALREGNVVLVVKLDAEDAYTLVVHKVLVELMREHGVPEREVKWHESYLEGRRTRIEVEGQKGPWLTVVDGIPQGGNAGNTY